MTRLLARIVQLLAALSVVRRVAHRDQHGAVTLSDGGPLPGRYQVAATASPHVVIPRAAAREDPATPRASFVTILKRTGRRVMRERVLDNAAALTYYAVMALVPSVLVVISLVGIFVSDPNHAFVNTASFLGIDQNGQIGQNLQQFLTLVTRNGAGAPTVLAFGTITALWSFSGAMGSLMAAVNRVWGREEQRNFALRRLLAAGLALVAAVVILIGIFAVALSAGLGDRVVTHYDLSGTWRPVFRFVPYVFLVMLVSIFLAVVYYVSPDKEHRLWRWISVGAITATLVWLLATIGFAAYVGTVASYSKVYGKLAAIPIALFWMYLSSAAILFGAALDAEIERAAPATAYTD